MKSEPVELAPGVFLGGAALPVIAGPCVVEEPQQTLEIARTLQALGSRLGLPMIFKASFDKANRSSLEV